MTTEAPKPDNARDERQADQINKAFGETVRRMRRKASMTLEQLASASNVSRAMLSSVERGEKSPTLPVLAGIAAGLKVTMSQLMGGETQAASATVIRRGQRLVFHDRATGIERHLLSPTHLSSGFELVEHVLPSGQEFASASNHDAEADKYIVVTQGMLTVEIDGSEHVLHPEDSIYMQVKGFYRFVNHSRESCRYYLFIVHKT